MKKILLNAARILRQYRKELIAGHRNTDGTWSEEFAHVKAECERIKNIADRLMALAEKSR